MLQSKACTDVMQKHQCCNVKTTFFACRCIAIPKVTKRNYAPSRLSAEAINQWYNKRYECTTATEIVRQSALGYYPPGSAGHLGESRQSGANHIRTPAGAGCAGSPTKCDPSAGQAPLSFAG